jgi:hypothetical protein
VSGVVAVLHPRAVARRALRQALARPAGRLRLCRSAAALERLLHQRLVDAVVLDAKATPEAALSLPRRFPRIPVFLLSAFRPDDGRLLAACVAAGVAGVLVEGVDDAVAGEWVATRTAQVARRAALAAAPRMLRLSDRLQLEAWEEVLRRVAGPTRTADVAGALRVTREHLSRVFAAGGAPNLKRVIDLARVAWRTRSRNCSIWIHESAIITWTSCLRASVSPFVSRDNARSHIIPKACLTTPTVRIAWWIRPPPRRVWATANPSPRSPRRWSAGTRTSVYLT